MPRWAARPLAGLGLVAVFVASLLAAIALHGDLPLARRLVAQVGSDAVTGLIGGRVVFAPPTEISAATLFVPRAELFDVYGKKVVELEDVRVDTSLLLIAHDVLLGGERLTVIVNHVRVARGEAEIVSDPKTGEPTIVAALSPKPGAPKGAAPSDAGLRLYFPSVELGAATVRVNLAGEEPVVANVRSVHGQILGTPKGAAIDVDRFGARVRRGSTEARGTGTLALRAPGALRGTFDGFFDDVEVTATAFLDKHHLEATLRAPKASPEAMGRVVPGWPLHETASADIEAKGDLPHLSAHAIFRAGASTLRADGPVTVGDHPSATLVIRGQHLDASLVVPDGPKSDVTALATVDARIEDGRPGGTATLHTEATEVTHVRIPALDAQATLANGSVTGRLDAHEPQAPFGVTFSVAPDGTADIEATTANVQLERVDRFDFRGATGTARTRLRARIEKKAVHASVDSTITELRSKDVRVQRAHVTAALDGKLDALDRLQGSARVEGTGFSFGRVGADRFTITARGGRDSVGFDARLSRADGADLNARGTVVFGDHVVFRDTKLSLRKDPVIVEGTVARVDPEALEITVRDLRVLGAGGTLTGNARLAKGVMEVEAEGEGIDLDAIARAVGLPKGTLEGKARISADIAAGRDVTRGRLRVGLGNATLGPVGGVSLQLSADLDRTNVTGEASGLVAGLGTFGTTFDVDLDGPLLEAASWKGATGRGEIQVSDLQLAVLGMLLPRESPVARLAGRAYARVLLERKSRDDALPNAFASLSTRSLTFDLRGDEGAPGAHVEGIDLATTFAFNGSTGESTGTTLAADVRGALFTATFALRADVDRLIRDPGRAFAQLVETPLDTVVSMPVHDIAELPELVRPAFLTGKVSANGTIRGTLSHPTLFVSADGSELSLAGSRFARPVDLHADGQYEWTTRTVSGRATASVAGRPAATATFRGVLPEEDPRRWTGAGKLDFDALPLDTFGSAGPGHVAGKLSGRVSLARDANGSLGADLRVDDAAIEDAPLGQGRLHVETAGKTLRGTLAFSGEHGSLDASGNAGLVFDGAFPALAPDSPASARFEARGFSATALSPLTKGLFTRLGGRLDGTLAVTLSPDRAPDGTIAFTGSAEGNTTLTDGTVLIDALGLELRELTASAKTSSAGSTTTIAVRDVTGKVRSQSDNVTGSADLVLEKLRLVRGTANLRTNDMPVLFRGAPQGRVTGQLAARLSREPDRMLVDIDIPKLTTKLPQASARAVFDQPDNPDISVLQYEHEAGGEETGLPWRLAVHLGKEVNLRRTDVDLMLSGDPVIDLGAETQMSGRIDLTPGGRVPILGKVFSIDHGGVVFDNGEPGNPRVEITATWRAPNDALVYVEVTGTLREAKIALRSDPPLPEPEVFALLLGGSSTEPSPGATTTANSTGAAQAVALGSGVAAIGVNQLITDNPVELRVETTSQSQPRYTAAVRIRNNLYFEASEYTQTGVGVTGATNRNVFSGTVDYRFTHRWSLRTEVGTAGGALDLLWQYRY